MSSKSSNRPKRPLTAYNLFYRYKRTKLIQASTQNGGDIDKDEVCRLIKITPGLENYPSSMQNKIPKDQLDDIRRTVIRLQLEQQLLAKDATKRKHRKCGNGFKLSFLEMNKIMVDTWKAADDFTKGVFKDLAEDGRKEHHRMLIEYNRDAHTSALAKFSFPSSPRVGDTPKLKNSAVHSQDLNGVSTTSTSCESEMLSLQSRMMELARLQLQFAGQNQPMMSNPSFSGQMQDTSNLKGPAFGATFLPHQQVQYNPVANGNGLNSHGNQNLGQFERQNDCTLQNSHGMNDAAHRVSANGGFHPDRMPLLPHQTHQFSEPARQVTCPTEEATQVSDERPSQSKLKAEVTDCSSESSSEDSLDGHKRNVSVDDFMQLIHTLREDN